MEADRDEMKQEIRAGKEHMQEAVMCRKTWRQNYVVRLVFKTTLRK
jgi:hypothetical protein